MEEVEAAPAPDLCCHWSKKTTRLTLKQDKAGPRTDKWPLAGSLASSEGL